MMLRYFLFISILLIIKPLYAHTFTGMNGFYDGLSHPVLGLDHFLAMVCVGVVSSQIGGRAILTVPSLFVLFMIVNEKQIISLYCMQKCYRINDFAQSIMKELVS